MLFLSTLTFGAVRYLYLNVRYLYLHARYLYLHVMYLYLYVRYLYLHVRYPVFCPILKKFGFLGRF